MEKDNIYQTYFLEMVRDVPQENLIYLVKLFMARAAVMVGNELGGEALNATTELVKQYYGTIPICYIASGFAKGSLGHYGDQKFCPRTINKWLNEISIEYNKDLAKKKHEENQIGAVIAYDLHKSPVGQAINQKIEWYQSGKLNIEDWDRVNLQELAGAISRHESIRVENYI